MPKLTEDELTAILAAEKESALSGMNASKLAEERERAMNYYNGDVSADMPSPSDRSKAVSYDVSDTVEGLMPSLMEIFCGGDEVVKFSPVSEEDVDKADQETAYVNHVYMQKNPGFIVTYSFVKDALLQKNGVVKIFWEEKEIEDRETFLNQPDDVYALLKADDSIKIVEHTEHAPEIPDNIGPQNSAISEPQNNIGGISGELNGAAMPPMNGTGVPPPMPTGEAPAAPTGEALPGSSYDGPTHDITIVTKRQYGCCRIEPVPPEEFGVSRRAKLGQPLDYCFHQVRKTQSALIGQGFDKKQVEELSAAGLDMTTEATVRDTVDESASTTANDINKANREILITEHYCMLDYEGDGKAKLYRVTTGGEADAKVLKRDGKLDIEQVEFDPFAAITPFIVTHRFFGKSAADLVIDIMRIKTSLLRGMLDNIYGANNQRLEVAESHSHPKTLDDILDNRIGGVVRTKTPGGLLPIPNQEIGSFVFPMVEYMDQTREWRTGVTRQGQGLEPDALQNIGQDAVIRAQNAAMEKTKLIARIFAETGFKDLFWKIHATVRRNESTKPTVQLRNKWITVDPREWKRRDDMTASVGLGSGSKGEQSAFWGLVISTQQEAMVKVPGLVKPGQLYNSTKKWMEINGERAVDRYWSNPDEQPPQPPPPDPKMVEAQGKIQTAQQKQQSDAQMQAAKLQGDQAAQAAKIQGDLLIAREKAKLDREKMQAEHQLKTEQMQAEFALRMRQMEEELALKREEIYIGASVDAHVAKVNAGAKVQLGGKPG